MCICVPLLLHCTVPRKWLSVWMSWLDQVVVVVGSVGRVSLLIVGNTFISVEFQTLGRFCLSRCHKFVFKVGSYCI